MAPTAAALSLDAAVGYSLAASLAYSPPAELRRGSGGYQQRLAPRLAFSQQVEVDRLRASATLFEMEEQDGVCVAFRGSTDLKNYLSMFNLFFEPSRLGTAKGGRVHRGYQEASLELYDRLSPLLASRQPQRLAFIGHSYGGGTATLCALAHAEAGGEAGGEASSVDEVVTFAGPRVGDTQFAMRYDELLGERTTHYVHDLDPVLAQNQPLWNALGFAHTGRRVRCAAAEPRLLADGDPSLGAPLNFADHGRYLGTVLGPSPAGWGQG
mmetsp:Transcript_3690/g.12394  ORF Transcript_3690/g.12394 Transcript_3690/m.12394 type:complete len:268 (+) Transcript_3690:105-908(+)|eukprot:CAMPEP_0196681952 /NCGR_PEP_ID=MMETSP1090-20130531/8880_1 /TAXON_ID=37098 /ORGANISM="Isochrysis sp, Strain CCMP1244" /LENGTH=267 /DNA_ID=CAMNT_0042020345 /DNA_START=40 /DNA_END=843 /DNA_ORIENTATION=+